MREHRVPFFLCLPLSLSLISTSEGKELVVNSLGFRIWAFSGERGRGYGDAVAGVLHSGRVCRMGRTRPRKSVDAMFAGIGNTG